MLSSDRGSNPQPNDAERKQLPNLQQVQNPLLRENYSCCAIASPEATSLDKRGAEAARGKAAVEKCHQFPLFLALLYCNCTAMYHRTADQNQ
eukprot:2046291-Rhodomonas_salina.3